MTNHAQNAPTKPDASIVISGVGALEGVGAAIARRFGRAGYKVVAAGRNIAKLQVTRDALASEGILIEAIHGDVTDPADVKRFVAAAQDFGPLTIAVHNAGSNRPAPFLEQAEDEFETHWREHALGGFNLARAALPVLLANRGVSRPGTSLIFTGASGSLRGKPGFAAFSAAKGALRNLSQSLAREFGPQGIHVAHVVIDGGINGERLLSKRPEMRESRGEDGLLSIDAIADAYWILHHQHRSAWTQELDLRPWVESY